MSSLTNQYVLCTYTVHYMVVRTPYVAVMSTRIQPQNEHAKTISSIFHVVKVFSLPISLPLLRVPYITLVILVVYSRGRQTGRDGFNDAG